MSHIFGKGWGDDHDWVRGSTNEASSWGTKATHYQCANCKQLFSHYYDNIPNIFAAMESLGVPEHCDKVPGEHKTEAKASQDNLMKGLSG